jgi:predicted alpha/beta-fold hydrolase
MPVQEKQAMPQDDVTAEQVRAQVEAEVEYHKAQNSIVAILPRIKNPTLVITSSNDLTNPPSNEVGCYMYGQ